MSEIIDLKDFMERVQDDKELLLELLDIFQEDFINKRQALDEAVKTKDIAKIKEIAHSLKGASGNISAKAMHANFLKIEAAAKSNDVDQTASILKDIDVQFAQIKEYSARIKKEFTS